MEEPEKTTTQLHDELVALRQRNAHLEATMARWQWVEDTARFSIFLRDLALAQQHADALHQRFLEGTPLPAPVGVEVLADLSITLEELHVAAEELVQQQEELLATRQKVMAAHQRYHDLFHFAPDGSSLPPCWGFSLRLTLPPRHCSTRHRSDSLGNPSPSLSPNRIARPFARACMILRR